MQGPGAGPCSAVRRECGTCTLSAFCYYSCSGDALVCRPLELHAYSSAYDEANAAAARVDADAAPALLKGGLSTAQFPASLGPGTFYWDGCGAIVASIDELRARCQAMVALKAYNQALLDIAAGKASDDILAQVDQAFRSVSSLAAIVPGSGAAAAVMGPAAAIFPALKGILGEALKLRDRVALRNTLMQGAPHIRTMIQSLRDDVDRLYVVQREYAAGKLEEIKSAIDRNLSPAFRAVAAHSPPTDPAVASSLGLLEQRFEEMFGAPEPSTSQRLKGIKPGTGKSLDGPSVALIESQLRAVAGNIKDFKTVATQFGRSSEALKRYDELLAAVDKSLTELLTASNQVFAQGGGTDQLVQSIVTIRDHARDIKQLLAAR